MKQLQPSGSVLIVSTPRRQRSGSHDRWHDHGVLQTTDNDNPNIILTFQLKSDGLLYDYYYPLSTSNDVIDAWQDAFTDSTPFQGQYPGEFFNGFLRSACIKKGAGY
jgi:hypothetical protein